MMKNLDKLENNISNGIECIANKDYYNALIFFDRARSNGKKFNNYQEDYDLKEITEIASHGESEDLRISLQYAMLSLCYDAEENTKIAYMRLLRHVIQDGINKGNIKVDCNSNKVKLQ